MFHDKRTSSRQLATQIMVRMVGRLAVVQGEWLCQTGFRGGWVCLNITHGALRRNALGSVRGEGKVVRAAFRISFNCRGTVICVVSITCYYDGSRRDAACDGTLLFGWEDSMRFERLHCVVTRHEHDTHSCSSRSVWVAIPF